MGTEGFQGFYVETRDYPASRALWLALGFEVVFETDHDSGQLRHPSGGPYVFLAVPDHDGPLETHPILAVTDAARFSSSVAGLTYARPFEPQHWGVTEALVTDPDGRAISLQAPLPG